MLILARRYIAHRRKVGYTMGDAGQLIVFARFADRVAPGRPVTTALALEWATSIPTRKRTTQVHLLVMIRCFAKYCAILDPRTEIPDHRLLGPGYGRQRPHIYTQEQIRLILKRARSLPVHYGPLHPMTYEAFVGLVACTGIRTGEARRLKMSDFDSEAGLLRIAPFKASPERTIPLHASAVQAVQRYLQVRRRLFPFGDHLFVGATGQPLHDSCVVGVFRRLVEGIRATGDFPHPRIPDFRHQFASGWINEWSRQSKPVSHHLLLLARYLGHLNFKSTWWYVSSDPQSLRAAADTFLRFHKKGEPSHEA